MDLATKLMEQAVSLQGSMNELLEGYSSPVQQFYGGATVFLTGGIGFLGKQILEKLFRSTKIKKVYLLIRSKKGLTAEKRLQEALKDTLFDNLHKTQADFVDKINAIEGDVANLKLGICEQNWSAIVEEVNIIFHVAATIRFDEPLITATLTNVRGTREVIDLATQCKQLRALVYISTAYSNATRSKVGGEVMEKFYPCPFPPDLMIELAENTDEEKLNALKPGLLGDWLNTYTFSKALAEELIRTRAAHLPVCIVRPSIVICTNCEPTPGWLDKSSLFGPSGMVVSSTMAFVHTIQAKRQIKIDFVPLDYVNNGILAAAWQTHQRTTDGVSDIKIYTLSSSSSNYITWGKMTDILEMAVASTLVSPQAMWYCFVVQIPYQWLFAILDFMFHDVPAFIVDGILVLTNRKPKLKKMYSVFKRLASTLNFFHYNEWIFDNRNTTSLYNSMSEHDKIIYNFDMTKVDWKLQIFIWVIGVRKYIIKDDFKNPELGLRRQFYFKIAHYFISGLVVCASCMVLYGFYKLVLLKLFF